MKMDSKLLRNCLHDLEKSRGERFNKAKEFLLQYKPVEAIDPLWKMVNKVFLKDETKSAIYEILTEIGSEKLV